MQHSQKPCSNPKSASGLKLLCLPLLLTACAGNPIERPGKTELYQPPASLLAQQSVPDWPAVMTNGELLTLARNWRRVALECNADKQAIERDVSDKSAVPKASTVDTRPWWQFW